MATVKSLSQMMSSAIGAGGDCETCGPGVTPTKVTRVAMGNLAKLNTPVSKVAAQNVVEQIKREVDKELISQGHRPVEQMKTAVDPEKKRGRPFTAKAVVETETEGAND